MNKGVRFASVEAGLNASAFEIQLRATFAAEERRKISERTKEALKSVKARGTKLGNPNWEEAVVKGHKTIKLNADKFATSKASYLNHLRSQGLSYSSIANQLNNENVTTARGGRWYPTTVKNLLDRTETLST